MNDAVVLDNITFRVDMQPLLRKLHVQDRAEDAQRVYELARGAEAIARPRALYRTAYIESKGDRHVVIDGVTLTSRVLRVNLDQTHRVFPFVATCGRELRAWAASIDDMVERFWADAIMETALRTAIGALNEHITAQHQPGPFSVMNPGSLRDWPMEQQRPLFEILGDVRGLIGAELTESFLMVPIKSVSGIRFATEVRFENCQLCPRERCPGRRAPYDPALYESRYAPSKDEGGRGV